MAVRPTTSDSDFSTYAGPSANPGDAGMTESDVLDYLNQQYRADPTGFHLPEGYAIQDGQVVSTKSFLQQHSWLWPLLAAGTAFGAPAIAGAVGGGGGASAATASGVSGGATSAVLPATATVGSVGALAPGLVSGSSLAGSLASAAPAAAGAGMTFANTLPLIGTGISALFQFLAGQSQSNAIKDATAAQTAAATHAAELQAQTAQEALDWAKQQYAQSYGNLAPYRNIGANATGRLSDLMGITGYSVPQGLPNGVSAPGVHTQQPSSQVPGQWTTMPLPRTTAEPTTSPNPVPTGPTVYSGGSDTQPSAPQSMPGQWSPSASAPTPPQATGAPPTGSSYGVVHMVLPDGTPELVPAAYVQYFQARGAKLA